MYLNKKTFIRKNGTQKGGKLYKWSPIPSDKKNNNKNNNIKLYYCTATPFSNGEDRIVTYVVEKKLIDYQLRKIAYVVCDYVK
jgi:hypothetical protein